VSVCGNNLGIQVTKSVLFSTAYEGYKTACFVEVSQQVKL